MTNGTGPKDKGHVPQEENQTKKVAVAHAPKGSERPSQDSDNK